MTIQEFPAFLHQENDETAEALRALQKDEVAAEADSNPWDIWSG